LGVSAVPDALSQEEILQNKLPLPPCKGTTAGMAGDLPTIGVGRSLYFDQLIKSIALRASERIKSPAHNHDVPHHTHWF
jgi:hypothetical protein